MLCDSVLQCTRPAGAALPPCPDVQHSRNVPWSSGRCRPSCVGLGPRRSRDWNSLVLGVLAGTRQAFRTAPLLQLLPCSTVLVLFIQNVLCFSTVEMFGLLDLGLLTSVTFMPARVVFLLCIAVVTCRVLLSSSRCRCPIANILHVCVFSVHFDVP